MKSSALSVLPYGDTNEIGTLEYNVVDLYDVECLAEKNHVKWHERLLLRIVQNKLRKKLQRSAKTLRSNDCHKVVLKDGTVYSATILERGDGFFRFLLCPGMTEEKIIITAKIAAILDGEGNPIVLENNSQNEGIEKEKELGCLNFALVGGEIIRGKIKHGNEDYAKIEVCDKANSIKFVLSEKIISIKTQSGKEVKLQDLIKRNKGDVENYIQSYVPSKKGSGIIIATSIILLISIILSIGFINFGILFLGLLITFGFGIASLVVSEKGSRYRVLAILNIIISGLGLLLILLFTALFFNFGDGLFFLFG